MPITTNKPAIEMEAIASIALRESVFIRLKRWN